MTRHLPGDGAASQLALGVALIACVLAAPTPRSSASDVAGGQALEKVGNAAMVLEAQEIGGVDVHTATLLLSGQEGGDVEGALLWTIGNPTDDGRVEVPFIVEVDGAQLINGLDDDRIAVAFLAYVVDDSGRIVEHIAQGIVVDPAEAAGKLRDSGLKFIGRTTLHPGFYDLRVMVREHGSGRFFLARTRLSVWGPTDTPTAALPLLFEDRFPSWIIVRQRGVPAELQIGAANPLLPAARPVVVEDQPAGFLLCEVGSLPVSSVEIELLDAADRVVAGYPLEVTRSEIPFLLRATLPGMDLPPGRYTLVVTPWSGGAAAETTVATGIVMVERDAPPSWVGRSTPRPAGTRGGGDGASDRGGRFRKGRARATYREVLAALAAGDWTAARGMLADLERSAFSADVLRSLRRIEDGVAVELGERNPRSLMPVAVLHHQMVRRYIAHRDFVLAAHARAVTADLAVRIGIPGNEPGFGAGLLVNLASDLSRSVATGPARVYLESALLLDPSHRPALLALGASLERTADYGEAARVFGKLVEADPENAEGTLRLAVNLARTGRQRDAATLFLRLLRGRPAEWIGVLAAQELARLMIAGNASEDALAVMETSIQRWPSDQRLRVLRAWVLDANGRSLDAVASILDTPAATQAASPRFRYGEWPDLGPEVSITTIRGRADGALPDLAAALATDEGS